MKYALAGSRLICSTWWSSQSWCSPLAKALTTIVRAMRFSIVFFMFLLIYNKDAVASLLSPCLTLKITIRDFGCQNPAFPTLDADSQSITTRFPTLHSVGNPALLPKTTRKPYTWKSLRRSSHGPCIATQLQYQKSYHTLVRSVPCFGTHRTTAWYYVYRCSLTVLVDYLESYSR